MAQSADAATQHALQCYWEIARDPCKRAALVEDKTCVQFLAYVLGDREPHIVITSLQILKLLSLKSAHRGSIRSVFGVIEAIESLVDGDERREIAELASEILNILMRTPRYGLAKTHKENQSTDRIQPGANKGNPKKCALKMTTLSVQGIKTPDDRWLCEEQLIKVKGVMSITFDGSRKQCIISSRDDVNLNEFVRAIARTGKVSAQVLESKPVAPKPALDKENSQMPQYLPEKSILQDENTGAVTAAGGAKTEIGTWWNSATAFISKSFYW